MTIGIKEDRKLLPLKLVECSLNSDRQYVIASFYEKPKGYRWWGKYTPLDFLDMLTSLYDLKHFGINPINK